jgi:hypothetical protein
MNKKKTARPAASAPEKADIPKKRSKLKLALLALAPLVLAGGGYACWTLYAAPGGGAAAHAEGESDAMQVAAITPEVAAETSFTHSYALSVLIAPLCGAARVPGLQAASEAEAKADGRLVNLSWLAAARRAADFTGASCDYLRQEVREAEYRAVTLARGKNKAAEKGGH